MKRCGACNEQFTTAAELVEHLKECPLAKAGTKAINIMMDEGFKKIKKRNQDEEKTYKVKKKTKNRLKAYY